MVTRTCLKFPMFADRVCKPMYHKSNRNCSVDDNSFLCVPASQAISGREHNYRRNTANKVNEECHTGHD